MRYMLLIYGDEQAWAKMPEGEKQKVFREHVEFTQSIRDSGAYRAGDPLQPTGTAATVRIRDGKTYRTDGPFAETKEQLGGYYIVEAATAEEAIAMAARIPSARVGRSIEVRPIMELPPPR